MLLSYVPKFLDEAVRRFPCLLRSLRINGVASFTETDANKIRDEYRKIMDAAQRERERRAR